MRTSIALPPARVTFCVTCAVATATYVLEAAAPTATPGTGVYTSAQSVTLASATPGAEIRYTLDGTTPDSNSPLYAEALPIVTGTVLTARAFKTDWAASDPTVVVYIFDYGTLAPPVASPPGGTYSEPQLVTLTAAPGATIRYTLDGSDPTEASSLYTTPMP